MAAVLLTGPDRLRHLTKTHGYATIGIVNTQNNPKEKGK